MPVIDTDTLRRRAGVLQPLRQRKTVFHGSSQDAGQILDAVEEHM